MKTARLKFLAVLQILLGGCLLFVAIATIILGQSFTRRVTANQAITAYVQSIADTKGLVTNTVASVNIIARQMAESCVSFASSADDLASGIEWWNTWLGKQRFHSLTDATSGFRNGAQALRTTKNEISARAADLVTLGTSFSTSCDSTIRTLNDLRDVEQPVIQLIWILGISGCCVAAVVLLSGFCLYGIAKEGFTI